MLSQTLEYVGCFSSSSLYAMGVLPSSLSYDYISFFINRGWSGTSWMMYRTSLRRSVLGGGLLVSLPRSQGADCTTLVSIEQSNTIDVTGIDPSESANC